MRYFSLDSNFWQGHSPQQLIEQYGSPLYVYNENIIRQRCREMASVADLPNFKASYSVKANTNPEIIRIVHECGLYMDAMSPGEIFLALKAGCKPSEILYISNNVSAEEMRFAVDRGVNVSVDSLSQLETYGKMSPGGNVVVRINPGIGAGHHAKVVTGGKTTKFGINTEYINEIKALLGKYSLNLVGINQHIGSLFMEGSAYIEAVKNLLAIAEQLPKVKFIDFGGGFGIPYRKQEGQDVLDVSAITNVLTPILKEWAAAHNPEVLFKSEPGRYIVAEGCILLGEVYSVKQNGHTRFVGTDLGFNVLIRPAMYDSHHEIEVWKNGQPALDTLTEQVTVVGNICESGDILAKDRMLPAITEGDILAVTDAGAYGYSMSSNYNSRLRPAEVMICADGSLRLIRRRERLEDLLVNLTLD